MTNCSDNTQIPRLCADKFEEISGRLGGIEAKLDELCDAQKTWGRRIWELAKAVGIFGLGLISGLKK